MQALVLQKYVYLLRNVIIATLRHMRRMAEILWKYNWKMRCPEALGDDVSEKLLRAPEFEVKFLMLSLSIYWMADRQSNPSGWLAAHFAGRWQTIRHTNLCLLMTLKHETKLYAGPSDLCESISKIILFAVATHFRLPPPIMALSSEGDRLE